MHGLIRQSSTFITDRIEHLYQDSHEDDVYLQLHYGDLSDSSNLRRLLGEINPDEVYNLAAQSHVRVSFDMPEYTGDIVALGSLRILESLRSIGSPARFYQASSSEMFGKVLALPLTEESPFHPRFPYAVAKVYAYFGLRKIIVKVMECLQ